MSASPSSSTESTAAVSTISQELVPQRMRAVVHTEYGTADVLHTTELDRPLPRPDEVLVRVHAAGLDRGTWHLMAGYPYAIRLAFGLRSPKNPVPGIDLAGVVVAIGPEVTRFDVGDEVFGIGKGTFAEFAVAREVKLAHKPKSLTFEQAAALPVSGLTALRGVVDVGKVHEGQRVLVLGASGGVGTYAVQIASTLGAAVTGVCSAAKADFVRSLGADHVIDYAHEDFAQSDERYDLILDMAGNASLSRLRRVLAPRGTLVIGGGEGGGRWTGGLDRQFRAVIVSAFVRQRLTMLIAQEHFSGLERLADLAESGKIVPAIEQTYRLEEAQRAMRHLEAGRARGKLVIKVN